MQVLLFYSMKQMGRYIKRQFKICLAALLMTIFVVFFKYFKMNQISPILTPQYYEQMGVSMRAWGFVFNIDESGNVTFNRLQSVMFEFQSMVLNVLLLIYYKSQIRRIDLGKPIGYIHHSQWLSQYMVPYYMYFLLIALDTFFAQNLIQMTVLCFMIMIQYIWALNLSFKNKVVRFSVVWSQRLYTLQLAFLALTQIPPIIIPIQENPKLENALQVLGLILNPVPTYAAVSHVFLICALLAFGQLYETTYQNYLIHMRTRSDFFKGPGIKDLMNNLIDDKEKDLQNADKNDQDSKAQHQNQDIQYTNEKHAQKSSYLSSYQQFVEHYAPYVYLWVIRFSLMVMSYAYHSKKGFLLLSWVLLSFMMPIVPFVGFTVVLVVPVMTATFIFLYFTNIPNFNLVSQIFGSYFYSMLGYTFRIPSLEIGIMFFTLAFFILLIPTRFILKLQRDEFKTDLFKTLTDKNSNFLLQLLFYVLKRIHILLLFLVFIFGMREINIYYIGLMFFFVVFSASLDTYRAAGLLLIYYAAFFIWLQYIWSLLQVNFDSKSLVAKLFSMLTFTRYEEATNGINQYLGYQIPYGQWTILFIYIFMYFINNLFKRDKSIKKQSPDDPNRIIEYKSTSEYYEAKCDSVLRKKFPGTSKILNRITQIFSQMMIIIILMIQGVLVVSQPPSIFFWGFLIFTLTLQSMVINTSDDNPKLYKKCARQSKILKYYTMFVLVVQVSYQFITDPNFLAQYGFDDLLQNVTGQLSRYFQIIGLRSFGQGDFKMNFISQIAFYIMAVFLETYFIEQVNKKQTNEDEELEFLKNLKEGHSSLRRSTVNHKPAHGHEHAENDMDESEEEDEASKVEYQFEKVRYTITYLIYKNMHWWRFIDSITLNFHLFTATVTVVFCTNWQVSLFMSFYLFCSIILCIRAAKDLHKKGQQISEKRKVINVEQAHAINKNYMSQASDILLSIRTNQWNFQYWLLILSMIIMYPTPVLPNLEASQWAQYAAQIRETIFWMFWAGLYKSPEDLQNIFTHLPLYIMVILLIIEKQAQKWSRNRFGCTIEEIRKFKTLDEQIRLIKNGEHLEQVNSEQSCQIPKVVPLKLCVTIGEAIQECDRIEYFFRHQTDQIKEERLKKIVAQGLRRKYFTQFRTAMKIVMEQTSLLLLLLSCSIKSNVISIFYLFILLIFLLIKNKTTGMLIMSYTFGITLGLQYLILLTNLTSSNNPYGFPPQFTPYPSVENPIGEFIVPWYPKIQFLGEYPTWAHFLGLDPEHSNINDIWYDFANLVLLTVYFFNYGNPINAHNIKVSFSMTKHLEVALDQYSNMMKKNKAMLKEANDMDMVEEKDEDSNDSFVNQSFSDLAADDSKEYCLGATYYLNEIKNEIFLYSFNRKAKYAIFIGWQVFTLITIFVFAFLCKSYFSLGYMIVCTPLIIYVTDFFQMEKLQQEGRTWKQPYFICGPLMIYSFIDICIQVIFGSFLHTPTFWTDFLGESNVWILGEMTGIESMLYNKKTTLAAIGVVHLQFSLLKCFNMFFIFLQSRIYESEGFQKFVRRDLKKLVTLAKNYKRMALTYRYNNWKLQSIVTLQENKKKMYAGVAELKMKLHLWRELMVGGLFKTQEQHEQTHGSKLKSKVFLLENQSNGEQKSSLESEDIIPTRQSALIESTTREPLLSQESTISAKKVSIKDSRKLTLASSMKEQLKVAQLKDILDKGEDYFEKEHLLKKKIKTLPKCASFYLWLKNKQINQILLLTDIEEATHVKKEMESGKRKINTDLEVTMMKDINIYYARKLKLENITFNKIKKGKKDHDDLLLSEMHHTQVALQSWNMCQSVFGAILEYIFTNCSTLAYFFMIVSQIQNAGLISIAYPFAVFGYALMEELRPGKRFWDIMLIYTIFILFMKFIFQLDCWLLVDGLQSEYVSINDWVLFGLWRVEGVWNLFVYILPEIMVMLFIMGQNFYELLIGLYEKREIDLENIQEARERFIKNMTGTGDKPGRTTIFFQEKDEKLKQAQLQEELDSEGMSQQQREALYNKDFKAIKNKANKEMLKELDDYLIKQQDKHVSKTEFNADLAEYSLKRRYSFIEDKELRYEAAAEIKKDRNQKKAKSFIKKYFSNSSYFLRLFPLLKEQKPGKDMYTPITFAQFIIIVYLISFYTQMDTVGTQNLDTTSQFSFNMVLLLFLQVAVMVIERYINRTNARVVVKKIGAPSHDHRDERDLDDKLMTTMKISTEVRSMSMHVDQLKTQDNIIYSPSAKQVIEKLQDETPSIILEQTKMTTQQIMKYFIQWFLLIFYHVLVFWYFPLNSNFAIYGTPTCDYNAPQFAKYGCLSFKQNITLIIFYIIFCYYFALSAMQIRYGLPDFKRGSSLMVHKDTLHFIIYLLYYNIPFMMELKTILDWCFTRTSLDMFQWLQLAQFQSEQYLTKIGGQNTFAKKLGSKIHWIEKCICGSLCVGIMMFFLVGPFFLFSNSGFIASQNLVTGLSTTFNVKMTNINTSETYIFPLFSAASPLYIQEMSELEFSKAKYNIFTDTKFFDYQQTQFVKIKNSSEYEWSISTSYKETFLSMLTQASQKDPAIFIEISLAYTFNRPGPVLAMKASGNSSRVLDYNDPEGLSLINQFKFAVEQKCDDQAHIKTYSVNIPEFLSRELRLTQQREIQYLPVSVKRNVSLSYSCENYWSIETNGKPIDFITFSDMIAASFISASSIMAFYLAVSVAVGSTFRKTFIYQGQRVFIVDAPNPDALLNLIDCIYLMRHQQKLKREEELFFVLMDLLRSPEMLKVITGSSLRVDDSKH